MSRYFRCQPGRAARGPVLLALVLSAVLTACSSGSAGGTATAGQPAGRGAKCGLGNGKKATGTPIKIGAIATQVPGIDFTDGPAMAKAYFDCVNNNGGINGRPVQYILQTEQLKPAQVASLARQLVQTDQVAAMVGNFSIIDCTVNHSYYESQGLNVIDSGVAAECYTTPHSAAVNMGPRYSADGAAEYLIRHGIKKLVVDTPNVPGAGYISAGPQALAKAAGIPFQAVLEQSPIQSASSVAIKLVQAAGTNGGIVINNIPSEALKILSAAQRLGLQNRAVWGCSTSCNTDFLAKALGTAWNGKLFVNAELQLYSASGADNSLYRQVRTQYAPNTALGSYGQMGFLEAKIATDRMLSIKGPITRASVNQALGATQGYRSDLLCKPWYYGTAPLHIPNNTDWTVTPRDGHMVQVQGCTPISAADPDIARARAIEKSSGL